MTIKHILVIAFLALCLMTLSPAFAATYYVSNSGNDTNPGTSAGSPWKTLTRVNNFNFSPGDVISFQCGSTWTGGGQSGSGALHVRRSGASGNPITFTSYASGPQPIIRNPGKWTFAVSLDAHWIIVEKLILRDSHQAGILIAATAGNNTVSDCEFIADGAGVECRGSHNLITRNKMHDLTMVVNTVHPKDDDYGAVAVIIRGPNNEVSYNKGWNCKAQSFDYGCDGGMIELYGEVDNSYIHHNWAQDCNGFMEVGGKPGSAKNVSVAYNVSINNGGSFAAVHNSDKFSSSLKNFKVENNTIIDRSSGWAFIWFNDPPSSGQFIFRNNIVEIGDFAFFSNVKFDRCNNLFHFLSDSTQVVKGGGGLQAGEILRDPLFVNSRENDLHLKHGSPAIGAGVNLGHSSDFDSKAISAGSAADMGAFPYGSNTDTGPKPYIKNWTPD